MRVSYLIQSCSKIPEIFDTLYEEGYMEAREWDESKVSALKLSVDAGAIAYLETKTFLKEQIFDQQPKIEQFACDMREPNRKNLSESTELLHIFAEAFQQSEITQE